MGPAVTPRWLLPDPDDQRLRLWVNDELKQDERAGDMLVGWRELVAAASARVTLEPGDVIAAGTPAGVGMPRARSSCAPGDVVRVAIEAIGTLRNPVVAPHPGGDRRAGLAAHPGESSSRSTPREWRRCRRALRWATASGSPAVTYSHTRSARRSAQLATCGDAAVGAAGSLRSAAAAAWSRKTASARACAAVSPTTTAPPWRTRAAPAPSAAASAAAPASSAGDSGPSWRTGPAPK